MDNKLKDSVAVAQEDLATLQQLHMKQEKGHSWQCS
jgi:hypothetical protein